ncbi:hypothetical protein BGLT_01779 [Caballeronia glathei]|nr:hypothetical protein [Caballeronia glathei]CDY79085.1 hypothetical protein BGLT_01779 [Caballeronia glathei]
MKSTRGLGVTLDWERIGRLRRDALNAPATRRGKASAARGR